MDIPLRGSDQEASFAFGPFLLLPRRQLLLAEGHPVRLGGRAFELLRVMVERPGELVTSEELIAAVWPRLHVHDGNLKVTVASLRRALGDYPEAPRFVATVARRGYRFVAPVTAGGAPALPHRLATPLPALSALPRSHRIIGRAQEASALRRLLDDERGVTIVGPGGVGKTALAIEVAHAIGPSYPGGVHFVDLSPVDDPVSLPAVLLQALGLPGNPADALAKVLQQLRAAPTLLLLDNCEHLQPAVAIFAAKFLAGRGASRLVATSRFPLGALSERAFTVEPLRYPAGGEAPDLRQALRFPAVEMLVGRAADLTGYRFVEEDCAVIARICRTLDGLPLALELAAAQLGVQGPDRLSDTLDTQLTVLRHSDGAVHSRQRTLQATMDWSYGLLSREEAAQFRLVSVFPDSFDQEDAVAVAAATGLDAAAVARCLGSLLAKSLLTTLTTLTGPAGLRFRLLHTTRLYAGERRRRDPQDALIQRSHLRRVLALFEQSEREWSWRESGEWVARHRDRLPDLRAALSWALDAGKEPGLGVRLAAAALPLWFELSALAEARRWTDAALGHARAAPCDGLALAKLADFRAWVMVYEARPMHEVEDAWLVALQAAERARQAGQHLRALAALALYLIQTGRIRQGLTRLEEFRALSATMGNPSVLPEGERALALAKAYRGDLLGSREILDRLAAAHALPDRRSRMAGFQVDRSIGIGSYRSLVLWLTGSPDRAASTARAAVEAAGTLGHLVSQSNALGLAALPVALCRGDAAALGRDTARLRENLEVEHLAIWVPVERFHAAALAEMRDEAGAIDALRAAVRDLLQSGYGARIGLSLSVLAEALARRQRLDEAKATLEEAFRQQDRQDQWWCRPELRRIEAAIHRGRGQHRRADTLLRDAIEEARSMGATAFELRAANDLAAHAIDQGRSAAATALLLPVYRRFTEGFTTRDLAEAGRLLARAGDARPGPPVPRFPAGQEE
ncbi:transcriptional regulator [Roseomonas nepalensis]|uniref:Transcriptional regulator n=1 Tax=Muricoccus nepalensis TaxID=1854500 RepID=A0A502GBK2_9PROT|nr:winged helix-turn-helix domain-containing protein [Roseomonas nepalensis]TPG59647.1 transcriptional regulator [Roseomonas nepalensis]